MAARWDVKLVETMVASMVGSSVAWWDDSLVAQRAARMAEKLAESSACLKAVRWVDWKV